MSFPETIFGICPVCGAAGADDPAPSSADAPATDTTGNGVVLEYYEGKLMCQMCIKQKQADAETKKDNSRRAEEERFRNNAGFANTVS
jgi:hypothetical protein